jgi:hypothetical protein
MRTVIIMLQISWRSLDQLLKWKFRSLGFALIHYIHFQIQKLSKQNKSNNGVAISLQVEKRLRLKSELNSS